MPATRADADAISACFEPRRRALFSGRRAAGHVHRCADADRRRVGERGRATSVRSGRIDRVIVDAPRLRSGHRVDALQAETGSVPARRRVVHLLEARADSARSARYYSCPPSATESRSPRARRLRLSRPRLSDDAAARKAVSAMKITSRQKASCSSARSVQRDRRQHAVRDSPRVRRAHDRDRRTRTSREPATPMTVGHGGNVIRTALDSLFIDELPGEDPHNVREIWQQLYFGKSHWIGRAGATTMAQAAIDIALWDIKCQGSRDCRSGSCWAVRDGGGHPDLQHARRLAQLFRSSNSRMRRSRLHRPGLPRAQDEVGPRRFARGPAPRGLGPSKRSVTTCC